MVSPRSNTGNTKTSPTDPVGPAVLSAEPDRDHQGGSTGLRVFWTRSAGHVDWYHVTLEDSVSGFTGSTRCGGFIRGEEFHICPHISGDSASTCWPPAGGALVLRQPRGLLAGGLGRTERVWTLLQDRDGVLLKNISLQNTATSIVLDHLQPGTMYTITVVTEAVGLQSSASIQAVTVPAVVSSLRLDHNGSSHSLQASWLPAEGGVDTYLLTLSAPGSPAQERRLTPNTTQVVFRGLTPGLRYELRLRTTAGGLSSETRASGRTVPRPVSGLSMTSDGKMLKISWAPPSGYWESYNVLLNNGSDVLVNQTIGRASTQLAFSSLGIGLVPGHLYEADVTVRSGSLSNTARCYGRLTPRPVQQLEVRHTDESSLSVLWRPPAGEWDRYSVVLRTVDSAAIVDQRVLSREATECSFYGLTSGCLYSVTVTTNSGNLSSSSSVTTRTTLAQVTGLQVSNGGSTDSLQVRWHQTSGQLDFYRILLVHGSIIIKNQSVEANTTSVSFHALIPGALYRVVLTTTRAGQSSRQTVAEGRTVPAAVGEVTVSNNGRTDFLSASWRPSLGEVDSYLVTLSDHDRTLHIVSVSKSSPECVFNSLVSGRLYNISIGSRSGLFYNHTLVQGRTQPSKVQNPTVTHAAQDDSLKVYWRHAAGDFDFYQALHSSGQHLEWEL
ncbi:receptor-type tyrosine-protein phosphatase beta-like [Takifugu flavidus]|uniref:receptor-type tyrosine-protein phosphatase beta-like n=1 Tax=Takifugu flavidus TaxID=433684 RepID=UPI0025442B30|nr:receptor-type tyrosine-protein phosphatase beta-like [Takifugu flavidus]